jgi:NADPH-dependent ferric siderophore reductase
MRPANTGPRRRPAPLRAQVLRTVRLTPALVRVTVTGPDFDRYRWAGPAAHFKLLLPLPGAADLELPTPDSDGSIVPGGMRATMRTYTARRFDPTSQELDIDIVLHADGPASNWAAAARPGARLAVSVPRSAGFTEDPTADWVLLAGDASALPAIATIAPTLTKPATILIALADPADQLDIGHPVQWLDTTHHEHALEHAAAAFLRPAGRGQAWIAAEAGVIRRIRAELLPHLSKDQLVTRGYWRAGAQNHPDHDYGDDTGDRD